jgi:plastocyanin
MMRTHVLLVGLLGVALAALMPLRAGTSNAKATARPRVITIEARGMAFRVDGVADPNPVLRLRAGEEVKVVLRNREPGMLHDFAVPSLKVATPELKSDQKAEITFRVPTTRGRLEYICRPHSLMMKGTIQVE